MNEWSERVMHGASADQGQYAQGKREKEAKTIDVIKWNCNKFSSFVRARCSLAHSHRSIRLDSIPFAHLFASAIAARTNISDSKQSIEKRIYESNRRIIAAECRIMWRHEECTFLADRLPFYKQQSIALKRDRPNRTAAQTHHTAALFASILI